MKRAWVTALSMLIIAAFFAAWFLQRPVFPVTADELERMTLQAQRDYTDEMARHFPTGELFVYPAGHASTVPVGEYLEFVVERDGRVISYMDLTYEIVDGKDCAAIYYNGNILALGAGTVAVKAYLDADNTVCGYGEVTVVPAAEPNRWTQTRAGADNTPAGDAAFEASISAFPDSYKPYLRQLHIAYPQWIFEPFATGLDFYDAVSNENLYDRNVTLLANVADVWKRKESGDIDAQTGEYVLKDTGWVSANEMAVAYYMDPRNFLDEQYIFQFEQLTYDESFHTIEGIEGILHGSFMHQSNTSYLDSAGSTVESPQTYAQAIMEAAQQSGVNPYYLAAKIKQEIGSTPSRAATGACPGYEGIYNFYNIGATDGEGNIERGLEWAGSSGSYNRPWTSPVRSIIGGAQFLAADYIAVGQFTGYLQKFNVNAEAASGLYTHQYMTNVSGAVSQAYIAYAGYEEIGVLDSPIVFSIPVFTNMPGEQAGMAAQLTAVEGQQAVVSDYVSLREGPAAHYAPQGTRLRAGEVVRVMRCVPTDAAYYLNRLFYPTWYEVEVEQDGETVTGFICTEFARAGCARVLTVGDTMRLAPGVLPGGADETIRYFSEDKNVATVSADGIITAAGYGIVKVVAYVPSGAAVYYTILVAYDA